MKKVLFWIVLLPVSFGLVLLSSRLIFKAFTYGIERVAPGFRIEFSEARPALKGVIFKNFSLFHKGKLILKAEDLSFNFHGVLTLSKGYLDVVSLVSSLPKKNTLTIADKVMPGASSNPISVRLINLKEFDISSSVVGFSNCTGVLKLFDRSAIFEAKGLGTSSFPIFSEEGPAFLKIYFFNGFSRGRASFQIMGANGRSALVGTLSYLSDDWRFHLRKVGMWKDGATYMVRGDVATLFLKKGIFLDGVLRYPGLRICFNGRAYPFPSSINYRIYLSSFRVAGYLEALNDGSWRTSLNVNPHQDYLAGKYRLSVRGRGNELAGDFSVSLRKIPVELEGVFKGNFKQIFIKPTYLKIFNSPFKPSFQDYPVKMLISKDVYLISDYATLGISGSRVSFTSRILGFTYKPIDRGVSRIDFWDWSSSRGHVLIKNPADKEKGTSSSTELFVNFAGENFTVEIVRAQRGDENLELINITSAEQGNEEGYLRSREKSITGVIKNGTGKIVMDLFPIPVADGFLSGVLNLHDGEPVMGDLQFDSWIFDDLSFSFNFEKISDLYAIRRLKLTSGKGKVTGRATLEKGAGNLYLKFSNFLPLKALEYTGPYMNGYLKVDYGKGFVDINSNLFSSRGWRQKITLTNDTVELSGVLNGFASSRAVNIKGDFVRLGGANGLYRFAIFGLPLETVLNSSFLSIKEARLFGSGLVSDKGYYVGLNATISSMKPEVVSIRRGKASFEYRDGNFKFLFNGDGDGFVHLDAETSSEVNGGMRAEIESHDVKFSVENLYSGYVNGSVYYRGNGRREILVDLLLSQGEINYPFLSLEDFASLLFKKVLKLSREKARKSTETRSVLYAGVVNFGDRVSYNRDGIFLKIKPGSYLRMETEGDKEEIFGRLDFDGGTIDLITSVFTVEKGYMEFLGNRIALDLTLKTRVEASGVAYDITMRIHGFTDAMNIELTSSPYLPREKIVALLGFSTDIGTVVRKVFDRTLVGRFKSTIENRIATRLGLRRLSLTFRPGVVIPTSIEDVQLSLEKSLGPNVQLYYSLGFENRRGLALRHSVSMHWNLGFASLELSLYGDSLENMGQEIIMVKRIEF